MSDERGLYFVVLLLSLLSCASEKPASVQSITAEFTTPGVLTVHGTKNLRSVEVRDESGEPLAEAQSLGREVVEMRFNWMANTSYRVVTDKGQKITVVAPESKPSFALRIHAPLGQNVYEYILGAKKNTDDVQTISVLADLNEQIDILVELEKLSDKGLDELKLSIQPELLPPKGPSMDAVLKDEAVSLNFEFDKKMVQSRIRVDDVLPQSPAVISLSGSDVNIHVRLFLSKRDMKPTDLSLTAWEMPCDAEGLFTAVRAPNQIALPNPVWQKIGAVFNVQTDSVSYYEPFVFERLDFENKRDQPLNLLLKSTVLDEKTGVAIPYFTAPDYMNTGAVKPVTAYCQVPAESKKSCVLPIFVKQDTKAGTYTKQIEIFSMGSNKALRTISTKASVLRSHALFSIWLAAVILITASWLLMLVLFYKKMVSAFGVRILVLLSLLGSMKFCLSFGGRLVSEMLYVFLGPFNCLVGGLLTEVLTYLIAASVLYLVPRVGAMTLAGIVSYLINGILFGSFGLTDILFTGSSIAFVELSLLAFRVTTFHSAPHRIPKIVPLMLALGLADAASTLTSLTLHSVFFRLFFADWYIGLQVIVTGFFYTVLGVYLGRSLGLSLRKVQL
jgi:hypothetical protein